MNELIKRVTELEKKVAELEKQIQAQPTTEQISECIKEVAIRGGFRGILQHDTP